MDNKICHLHNEPVQCYEQDAQQNTILLCKLCAQQSLHTQKKEEDFDIEQKLALKQLELKYDQSLNQLGDFNQKLESYTQLIVQKLKNIQEQVEQNISLIIKKKNEIKSKRNNFTPFQFNQINEEDITINNQLTKIQQYLDKELKELEINVNLDQFYQSFNDFSIYVNNIENEKQIQRIGEFNTKFHYQFMQQSSYKQKDECRAIAFNKDGTIMIASCYILIKVFEFKQDKLREVQQLNDHQHNIFCLQFMKKSNQFISTSYDSTIIIWELNQNNKWHSKQISKVHKLSIYCITMNQSEDLLISGSADKTIKFWSQENNLWITNQSIDCQSEVNGISLNDQGDKLIASLDDNLILIIQLQRKEWKIKQKIEVEQFGYRLCFINQDQFVFQSHDRQYLQIFNYEQIYQDFIHGQTLQYQSQTKDQYGLFPIRYIAQIGLTMVKYGFHVHFIKRSLSGQFTIEQSINFGTNEIFGTITDYGRYIATWDSNSKQIYMRKFEF